MLHSLRPRLRIFVRSNKLRMNTEYQRRLMALRIIQFICSSLRKPKLAVHTERPSHTQTNNPNQTDCQ